MRTLEEVTAELETLKPILKKRFKVEAIDKFAFMLEIKRTKKVDINLLVTHSTQTTITLRL